MQEELKRSNSIGSASGIDIFLELVFVNKTTGIEAIQQAFRYHALAQFNYHLALLFFQELKFIEILPTKILLTENGEMLTELSLDRQKERIAEKIFDYLTQEKLISYEKITIDPSSGELRIPTNVFSLSAAIYRNFLYEIGCFSKNGTYFSIVNKKLLDRIEKEIVNEKRKLSQEELLLKLKKQQEDGDAGEIFVVEYETKRLSRHQRFPKRISSIDVSAGYDILSYQNSNSQNYDRYIEVKSYRGKPHFYWSANEKKVAEALGENYFLYLVDLSEMERNRVNYMPTIIADPAETLCSEEWMIEPDSYRITYIR